MSGARRNASQKLPVDWTIDQASTVPIMKKSPCAKLMISRSPKMMDKPSAIKAMIKPQINPLIARASTRSIRSLRIGAHQLKVRLSTSLTLSGRRCIGACQQSTLQRGAAKIAFYYPRASGLRRAAPLASQQSRAVVLRTGSGFHDLNCCPGTP